MIIENRIDKIERRLASGEVDLRDFAEFQVQFAAP